jgi:predicted dehydrogenase
MNRPLVRVGILSFAHGHAYSYAEALNRNPLVSFVGLYDADSTRGKDAAARTRTRFFSTVDAILEESLDAAIICSENSQHLPLVEQAAGKVRSILCEKPIATTIADAQAIIAACERANSRLQIAFPVRFAPAIQQLKTMLDAGSFGRVFSAKCTNQGSLPSGWFIDRQLSGGGAVMDHTVHVIDLLRWFWQTEVTEVFAEVGSGLLHPNLGIDDVGLLSFQLANGTYGTLDTSWSRPKVYPFPYNVKIDLIAEHGVASVDALHQVASVSSDQLGTTRWLPWGSDMDYGLIADFVDMAGSGRLPTITGVDGLRALEVALAAYESAETGRPVHLARTTQTG